MTWARATFECSRCGAVFSDSAGLRAHAVRHPARIDAGRDQGPAVTFACSHCADSFASRWGLRAHLLHHGIVAAAEHGTAQTVKARVVSIPPELSGRRAAATRTTATPKAAARERPRSGRRRQTRRIAVAAAALLAIFVITAPALAWWTTSATTASPARISTGTWGSWLSFSPGCSQAVLFSSSGCSRSAPIAAVNKHGDLALDFGDVVVGSSTTWVDVFRVTSVAPASLHVTFQVAGALGPFISSVGFVGGKTDDGLDPKQTRSVAVRFIVPAISAPGVYEGALTMAVVGGERHLVPMTVIVLAQRPHLVLSPGCSQATHFTPSGCGQSTPIATLGKLGDLSLDFGDATAGAGTNWADVLRVTSSAPVTLRVSFVASGTIAPFIGGLSFACGKSPDSLDPNQTRSVAVRLVVPSKAIPATYSGTLTVAADDGEKLVAPMTLTIIDKGHRHTRQGQRPLVSVYPGRSTALPVGSATLVAATQTNGALALDFGQLPFSTTSQFSDVVRIASRANVAADVTLSFTGPASGNVRLLGAWDANQARIDTTSPLTSIKGGVQRALTLRPWQTIQLAVAFAPGANAPTGNQAALLTIAAVARGGRLERWRIPVILEVLQPTTSPSASPSPSPATSPTETTSPSPSDSPVPPSDTPAPSPTSTPSSSPQSSASPVESPSSAVSSPTSRPLICSASTRAISAVASAISGMARAVLSLL